MALQHEKIYTIEHIYTLPEGQRAELINGQMHMMAPPTRVRNLSGSFCGISECG